MCNLLSIIEWCQNSKAFDGAMVWEALRPAMSMCYVFITLQTIDYEPSEMM